MLNISGECPLSINARYDSYLTLAAEIDRLQSSLSKFSFSLVEFVLDFYGGKK